MNLTPDQITAVKAIEAKYDADVFIFNSSCYRQFAYAFRKKVSSIPNRRPNAFLILVTEGGDADAAYIVARCLRHNYKKFMLYVGGWCKSAGTLIALGADPIFMSDFAEFGPLDVQISKADEPIELTSGQDVFKALSLIPNQAFSIFQDCFWHIKADISDAITTKTASDVAATLALGILTPICEQIEPLKLGEAYRNMSIAEEYGLRLCPNRRVIAHLISGYSTHSFVIDRHEMKALFKDIKEILPLSVECKTIESSFDVFQESPRPKGQELIEYLSGLANAPVPTPPTTPPTHAKAKAKAAKKAKSGTP